MISKILVPTDGSETAARAFAPALQLARLSGASVLGVSVCDPYPYAGLADSVPAAADAWRAAAQRAAETALRPLHDACRDAGIGFDAVLAEDLHPWQALLETARDRGCDLVVMASHGRRGVKAVLLGSETQKVLTHAKIPVMVVR